MSHCQGMLHLLNSVAFQRDGCFNYASLVRIITTTRSLITHTVFRHTRSLCLSVCCVIEQIFDTTTVFFCIGVNLSKGNEELVAIPPHLCILSFKIRK
jgi:hypothetical protein